VAGKRAGLDGARSGLWFEFQRIVSELRPAYVLVENVPGLLSSNRGRDFEVILRGLGDLGYAVSWAILDAQHFGVAQRRRRVFIVAGPDPGSTEAILAIAEGCAGHPQAGRTAGEDVAAPVGGGASGAGRTSETIGEQIVAKSLSARANASHREDSDTYIPEVTPNDTSVRRLTPVECARLQGFPNDWLDRADAPQYRALGNAVCVPVVEWIGRRIMAVADSAP
jgi:DNA (cytosine-5)-methyltransferase 1